VFVIGNYYQRNADWIDLSDIDFFKYAIDFAILKYETEYADRDHLSQEEVANIKKNDIPVIISSTITSKKKDEVSMKRKAINERIKMRSIILDADFEKGDEEQADLFKNNCILVAKQHNTPILIYPTPSYPEKPRFRVVFFAKSLLNEDTYYQAVHYLYDQLKFDMTDKADENIKSTNNAPYFINKDQVNNIYSDLDNKELQPLDNKLWKEYPRPKRKKKKQSRNHKSFYDEVPIFQDQLEEATKRIAPEIQDYTFFWKFASSVYRAEYHGQISNDQAIQIMQMIADYSNDESQRQKWFYENVSFYNDTKSRMYDDSELVYKAMPLLAYQEYKESILE